MKLVADVAVSAGNAMKRKAALKALLSSSSWQTFATIAVESAPAPLGTSLALFGAMSSELSFRTASAPSAPPRDLGGALNANDAMDADIPSDLYDQAAANAAAGDAGPGGARACPHCASARHAHHCDAEADFVHRHL